MTQKHMATGLGVCAAVLVLGLTGRDISARPPLRLFCIERSKNANIACYDVSPRADGTLDSESPVDTYWIMRAEDGRREELTWFERRWAYGYRVVGKPRPDRIQVQLMALPSRRLTIERRGASYPAMAVVNGRRSRLRRIYVHSVEGAVLPRVLYVDVWGTDLETKESTYERLRND